MTAARLRSNHLTLIDSMLAFLNLLDLGFAVLYVKLSSPLLLGLVAVFLFSSARAIVFVQVAMIIVIRANNHLLTHVVLCTTGLTTR